MDKHIVFKNMEHSDVMREIIEQQMHKIEEFLTHEAQPVRIDLFCEPSKVHEHHRVDLHIKSPHYNLNVSYEKEGMDFYQVLDHVIDVMYRNLLEEKRKQTDKRNHPNRNNDDFSNSSDDF